MQIEFQESQPPASGLYLVQVVINTVLGSSWPSNKRHFMPKDHRSEELGRGWVACRLSKSFPTSEASPPSSLLLHPSEVSETFGTASGRRRFLCLWSRQRGEGHWQVLFISLWSLSALLPPLYQGQIVFISERPQSLWEQAGAQGLEDGAGGRRCFTIFSSPLTLKTGAMPAQASMYLPTLTCHSCPGLQVTAECCKPV